MAEILKNKGKLELEDTQIQELDKTNIKDLEAYHRINYLYQLIMLQDQMGNKDLRNFYTKQMIQMAQTKVLRLNKDIKKIFCKKCFEFMEYPDKIKCKSQGKKRFLSQKCKKCGRVKNVYVGCKNKEKNRKDNMMEDEKQQENVDKR